MSTVTVSVFRGAFPSFADPTKYPDSELQFWLDLADTLHNAARWGDVLPYGIQLFTAHNLSLEFNAKNAAVSGQNPGAVVGPVTSGSVDKVSYSRDAAAAMDPANGHWNLSIYGLRYIRLVKMAGAGPLHIGAPSPGCLPQVGAWPGPILTPPW